MAMLTQESLTGSRGDYFDYFQPIGSLSQVSWIYAGPSFHSPSVLF